MSVESGRMLRYCQLYVQNVTHRRVEECRESREPVVNVIKGQQVNASHAVTPRALLCSVMWASCFQFHASGKKTSLLPLISQENTSENELFFTTTYHYMHTLVHIHTNMLDSLSNHRTVKNKSLHKKP